MPTQAATGGTLLERIVVRIKVGNNRMSGTDDPVYLRLGGPSGREFRLARNRGHAFRRGQESIFVLAGPSSADTNVAHPELNDPTRPALQIDEIERVFLVKGMEPLPNVRGFGEMDDRLEIESAEIELHSSQLAEPRRFCRNGPIWLGIICGSSFELGPVQETG